MKYRQTVIRLVWLCLVLLVLLQILVHAPLAGAFCLFTSWDDVLPSIGALVVPTIYCPLPLILMACVCHTVLRDKTSVLDKPASSSSQHTPKTHLAVPTGFLVSAFTTLAAGSYMTIDISYGKYSALGASMAMGAFPLILFAPLLLGFALGAGGGSIVELLRRWKK